jgi:hypothetical protein
MSQCLRKNGIAGPPRQATGMPQFIQNPELPLFIPGVTKKKILGKYLHNLKIYRKK